MSAKGNFETMFLNEIDKEILDKFFKTVECHEVDRMFREIACKNIIESRKNSVLVDSDGKHIPKNLVNFKEGERVVIKDQTFEVAYVNEKCVLFELVPLELERNK
jgi:hypothetical protein